MSCRRVSVAASGEALSTMSNRSNYPAGASDPRDDRYRDENGHAGFDEDPLVELARIVSEGNAKYRPVALAGSVDEPEAPRGSYDARRDLIDHEAWARDLEASLSDDFGGYAPEPVYRDPPAQAGAPADYREDEGTFEEPVEAGQPYPDDGFEDELAAAVRPDPRHRHPDEVDADPHGDEGYPEVSGHYAVEPGADQDHLPEAGDTRAYYGEGHEADAGYAEAPGAEPAYEPGYDDARYEEPLYTDPGHGAPGFDVATHDPYAGQVPVQTGFDEGFYASSAGGRPLAEELTASLEDELLGAMSSAPPRAAGVGEPAFDEDYPAGTYRDDPDLVDEPSDDFLLDDPRPAAIAGRVTPSPAYRDEFDEAVDDIFLGEPEAPPPPGGYDLDEVAQAMREGDPQLGGHGVLPPHSQREADAAPEAKSRRGLYTAAAVLGLVVLGGGAFALMDFGDEASGPPPVITADGEPMKVYPEGQEPAANGQSKLIYDRVGGVETPREERLVLQDETPVASLPPAPDSAANDGSAQSTVPAGPRRVRTVVVRPDGTIISGDEPETTPLPAQPAASQQPAEPEPAAPRLPTSSDGNRIVSTEAARTVEDTAQAAADAARQVRTTAVVPDGTPATIPGDGSAPTTATPTTETAAEAPANVPRTKPGDIDNLAAAAAPPPAVNRQPTPNRSTQAPLDLTAQAGRAAAPAAPAAQAPAPAATDASIPSGAYIVQVSSQRTEDQAQAAFSDLQRRYGSVLGGVTPVIQRADLGDRGTFYRVRIPAGSRDDAISLCERLKSAGGDCFVRRN